MFFIGLQSLGAGCVQPCGLSMVNVDTYFVHHVVGQTIRPLQDSTSWVTTSTTVVTAATCGVLVSDV